MTEASKDLLIVDDSSVIISRLLRLLEELQPLASVRYAMTFAEAYSIIKTAAPAIVLLDMHLPDGSGIDLLQTIKKQSPATIVVMLSNQAGQSYRHTCKVLGCDYFIDKSTEFEDIPLLVDSLLRP